MTKKIVHQLRQFGRSVIAETELQQMMKEVDYQLFFSAVEKLVAEGVLAPVKASGRNGRIPSLFNRYRIIKPKEDLTEAIDEMRRLNPALNIAGYLNRPELFKKHREVLEGLSRYLWFSPKLLEKPMSRKERSFSIWGREKFLDRHLSLVREILKFNNLTEDFLHYYDTPEPFFEYVHEHHCPEDVNVLILENKDTWFTFRKLMQETGKNVISATPVHVLLYGEGNKISQKGALKQYQEQMLAKEAKGRRHFLYFGDLDPEGIRLFFRAREANPGLNIHPFSELYRLMVRLAENLELPKSSDKRGIDVPFDEFFTLAGFSSARLMEILMSGRYIPQEILNYQVIREILS